ncbi:hypothetical protein D3Z50_06100 [Clostridiaceae bacterium]|nr:hypothetical protein [Clostridiaceae bacterium]
MSIRLRNFLKRRSAFKIAYFIFLSLNMIQIFNISIFSRFFLALFSVWGMLIMLQEYLVKRNRNYFHNNIGILFCFLFCCACSFIFNWDNRGPYNIMALFYYGICIMVLYINTHNVSAYHNRNEIVSVAKLYVLLCTVVSYICVYTFLVQMNIDLNGRNGRIIHIGVWENRLFGVFSSPNVGGTFFSIGIFFSVYLLYCIKQLHIVSRYWSFVCWLNQLGAIWYMTLSLSRGTWLSFCVSSAIAFTLYKIPSQRHESMFNRILKKTGMFIIAAASIILCCKILKTGSIYIVNMKNAHEVVSQRIEYRNENPASENSSGNGDHSSGSEVTSGIDISNKRFGIWRASVKLALQTPVPGVGNSYYKYNSLSEEAQSFFSSNERIMIEWSKGEIHNGYLQIFVCCGIAAFFLYFVFLFLSLYKVIIFFKNRPCIHYRNECVCLFAVVLYILVNNLFETNMALMGANSFQAVFWLCSGYVVSICNIRKRT